MSNTMTLSLEADLVNRNAQALVIDRAFEVIKNGIQVAMCSDCCSSNGNSCDPNDPYNQSQ